MAEAPIINVVVHRAEVVKIEPGDKIVVRVPNGLAGSSIEQIRSAVERWAGDGVAVLIVPRDLDVQVARRDEKDSTAKMHFEPNPPLVEKSWQGEPESWRDREPLL